MRWSIFLVFLVAGVDSVPKKKSQVFMATIDLDTDRKQHADPEVILDIGSQLPVVKRNVTVKAPDYGDYEDYELTAKPEEILLTTTLPTRKVQIRDEVARLMGDLHREELTLRTTVSKEDMTPATPVDMMLLGNETMFFSDEEGSGEMVEDEVVNSTSLPLTTRKPLLFTTLIQEVKDAPVTAKPDPFAHLDYDLSDHSNLKQRVNPNKINNNNNAKALERQKTRKLHGGAVGTEQQRPRTPIPIRPRKPERVFPVKNRKVGLRKMKKIERSRRVKNLNHRLRAQNRMRLRKVLSKMLFGPRDSDVTTKQKPPPSKRRLVGSNGIVTANPWKNKNQKRPIDFQKRDKRSPAAESTGTSAGGRWDDTDTVPIEKSIIESIHFEPHPYYHLREMGGKTEVEPSPLINEDPEELEEPEVLQDPLPPIKSGLVQVKLERQRRPKMVTLKSVKKVSKKEKNANGVALVVPSAKKPTMLELLIGDFLERIPPTARNPYLTEEQWS
ncbi:hypothetical protein CAEBREN_20347 [Caenorhabditis brenneri]|uniref:Uncharacterized protein n=1 Tax=Caenorhabditis brenneri TaxID=135651 RepID=G0NFJ7_CAEBE|nr:hypothetical protein CAEBREN_20347 [Caenorhabditis brenneri]